MGARWRLRCKFDGDWSVNLEILALAVRIASRGHELGPVENQDSHFGGRMIQAPKGVCNAPILSDGRPMGEDGAPLSWQARPIPAAPGSDGRLFLEAILWIARTGSPWRDLPPAFGKWNTVFKRFRDWVKADVFKRMFDAVSDDPDMEYAMIDATIVKVHRHGQGAKGGLRARP